MKIKKFNDRSGASQEGPLQELPLSERHKDIKSILQSDMEPALKTQRLLDHAGALAVELASKQRPDDRNAIFGVLGYVCSGRDIALPKVVEPESASATLPVAQKYFPLFVEEIRTSRDQDMLLCLLHQTERIASVHIHSAIEPSPTEILLSVAKNAHGKNKEIAERAAAALNLLILISSENQISLCQKIVEAFLGASAIPRHNQLGYLLHSARQIVSEHEGGQEDLMLSTTTASPPAPVF